MSRSALAIVPAVLALADLIAQDLRLLDRSTIVAAAADWSRQRLIGLDALGHTLEFDGSAWRQRPVARLDGVNGKLVFSPAERTVLFVGIDANRQFAMLRLRGNTWQTIASATRPGPRTDFALAFDAQRDELVLFGGRALNWTFLAETWIYDGVDWRRRQPTTSPPPRSDAAAAYDIVRGRLVVYSGESSVPLEDTWEWDGTDWLLLSATSPPGMMWGASMAYDLTRQRSCLFGNDPTGTMTVHEWDGATWLLRHPIGGLPTRQGASAVFDPALGEIVVTGGRGLTTEALVDTWSYDGHRWSLRDAATQPFEREFATAFADPGGGLLLLTNEAGTGATWKWSGASWQRLGGIQPPLRFGGSVATGPAAAFVFGGVDGSGRILDDFWRFDGTTWSPLPPGPGLRFRAGLAHDLARNEVVLFGGGSTGTESDETWLFDGTSWRRLATTVAPSPRVFPAMTFDATAGNIVLFGGYGQQIRFYDTWRFDGVRWTPVPFVVAPVPQGLTSLAYDSGRARVVLTDSDRVGAQLLAWTLETTGWQQLALGDVGQVVQSAIPYTAIGAPASEGLLLVDDDNLFQLELGQAAVRTVGTPCTPAAATVAAVRHARPGTADFALEVANVPNGAFALLALDFAANPMPVLGCTLHVQPVATALLGAPQGSARLPLPLPASPALLGSTLWGQAATVDAGAPAGVTFSAALEIIVGV